VRYFHGGLAPGAELSTDAAGAKVWERRYEPYGAPVEGADFTDEPQGGLGKPVDASTGLADHGARWSSFATARWLSADPRVKAPVAELARAPWELAPYTYAGGSPTLYWDPDGRDLRITGANAKELANMLAETAGIKMRLGRDGLVSLAGDTGGGSDVAGWALVMVAMDRHTRVELRTVDDSSHVLVGQRGDFNHPGLYLIDLHDVRLLSAIDEKVAKAAVFHEVYESYLQSQDPRPSSYREQHAVAIQVENNVLQDLGSDVQRLGERTETDPDDGSKMHITDYGKFELDVSVSADTTETGDVLRKDH
jgi:RHS repeat-associated protein